MYRLLSLLCFVFLGVNAVPKPSVANAVTSSENVIRRRFGAASRSDHLSARADSVSLSTEASILYAEGSSFGRPTSLSSEVKLQSNKTILVLEQYEHLFSNIECKNDTITLSQTSYRSHTSKALHNLDDGYIITSHHGCNKPGGRQVYQILSVDDAPRSFSYQVKPLSWRQAFGKLDVAMRRSSHGYRMRPHEKLPPYPLTPYRHGGSSGTPANISAGPTATAAGPRTTETGADYSLNLDHSLVNASLGVFEIALPGGVETSIPVELGCVNCSTYGNLDLEFADFSVDGFDLEGGGSISAQGMGAHVELFTKLPQSWEFDAPIPGFGYTFAYEIEDFFNVNLDAGFHVVGGYEMEGEVEMTYGFEVTVPDGSNITIDIGDPENSSVHGFDNISTNLLPFQSHVDLQSLDAWIAFRSVLSLGIEFLDSDLLSASGGIHLDTPNLQANITPVTNVDVNCEPLPESKTPYQLVEESVLDTVIRIDATAGVELGAEFTVMDFDPVTLPIPSLRVPLGTMCLNHDSSTQSYVTAQKAVDVEELRIKEKAEEAAKAAKALAEDAAKKIDKIFANSAIGGRELVGGYKTIVALSFLSALFCTMY